MSKPLQILTVLLLLAGAVPLTGVAYASDKDKSDSDSHHQSDVSDGAHHGELNGHISIHGW